MHPTGRPTGRVRCLVSLTSGVYARAGAGRPRKLFHALKRTAKSNRRQQLGATSPAKLRAAIRNMFRWTQLRNEACRRRCVAMYASHAWASVGLISDDTRRYEVQSRVQQGVLVRPTLHLVFLCIRLLLFRACTSRLRWGHGRWFRCMLLCRSMQYSIYLSASSC